MRRTAYRRRVKTKDPDIFEVRTEVRIVLTLLGLVVFLMGCSLIILSLGYFQFKVAEPLPLIAFGGVFFLLGLIMMAGRTVVIMHRRNRTIVKWHGLLVPIFKSRFRMDDFDRVTIEKQIIQRKNGTVVKYLVRLESSVGATKLVIDSSTVYHDARVMAESLTKFLRIPMADSSSGTEVVRELDKLDESFRDKAQRTGEELELPDPPPDMKTQVTEKDGTVLVDIPPIWKNKALIYILPIMVVSIAATLIFFVGGSENIELEDKVKGTFILIVVVGGFFSLYAVLTKKVHVKASRDALILEESVMGRKKVTTIPGSELEEFGLEKLEQGDNIVTLEPGNLSAANQGSNGDFQTDKKMKPRKSFFSLTDPKPVLKPEIIARSDRATIQFGGGLSYKELAYIHAVIKKAMIGERDGY